MGFTNHKGVSERLTPIEDSLQLVIDTTPALIHTALPDGSLDFFNRRWLEYVGLPLSEVLGWRWTTAIYPEDVEQFVEKWRASVESGEPFEAESRVRRSDGEYRWFLHRKVPLRDEVGTIVKWYGSSIEIEDRMRAEDRLREAMSERTRLSAVRAEIGMALARKDNLGGILHTCAEAMVRHLDAAFARILTLNSDSQELELQASAEVYTRLDGRYSRIPLGQLKIGLIAQERRAHLTNDVQNDPRIDNKDWVRDEKMTSFAGYPLVVEDRVVGVMGMFSQRPLTESTLHTLSFLADGIAQGIQRKQAEEKLRRSEALLAESEQRFRLIVDSIPGLVLTMTAEGELEFVSQQCLDYFGLTLDKLQGWTTSDIVHRDDLPRVLATWRHSIETGDPYDSEYRIRRADGIYRWFHVRALPVRDTDGRIIRWYALHADIDDRKRVEEALRASEEGFSLTIASIPVLVNTMGPSGELESANQRWLDYHGKTLQEMKGWETSDVIHPDDLPRAAAAWERSVETGQPFENEYRIRRADGVYRWFQGRSLPLRNSEGRIIRWYSLITDIDERKQSADRLQW